MRIHQTTSCAPNVHFKNRIRKRYAGKFRARQPGADSKSNEGKLQDFELISLEGVGVICIEFPELVLGVKRTYMESLTPILKPGLCTIDSPAQANHPARRILLTCLGRISLLQDFWHKWHTAFPLPGWFGPDFWQRSGPSSDLPCAALQSKKPQQLR